MVHKTKESRFYFEIKYSNVERIMVKRSPEIIKEK